MTKLYVGDVGSEIILETGMDLTGALSLNIIGRRPDFSEFVWTATQHELTHVKHVTALDELNMDGIWTLQSDVEMLNGNWLGESVSLEIFRKFN
jgi:hypothetical protein